MDVPVPDNYQVGTAAGDGDCFFDSFAAGLRQLRADDHFTIESLRVECATYAERHLNEEGSWLKKALESTLEKDSIEAYAPRIRFSSSDIGSESANVLGLRLSIWGRPDIEGRILCDIYGVRLHVIEKHFVEGVECYFDQLVDKSGSKSVDVGYYGEEDVVHIVNKGDNHFEPVLKKVPLTPEGSYIRRSVQDMVEGEREGQDAEGEDVAREEYDEGVDSDSSEDEKLVDNYKLIETIRSKKSSDEKIAKMCKLLDKRANVNFPDGNYKRNTPLHIAIKKKDIQVIQFLLDNDADVNAENEDGKSPLDLAQEYRLKWPDILRAIRAYLSNDSEPEPDPDHDPEPEEQPEEQPEEEPEEEPEPEEKEQKEPKAEIPGEVDDSGETGVEGVTPEEQTVAVDPPAHEEHGGQGDQGVEGPKLEGTKSEGPSAEGTYDRREGAAGAGGHFLKRNLLTYYKLQGDNKLHKFYLAGNMVDAGTFHDVVLRYCDESESCCAKDEHVWKLVFLQAKHTESDKGNLSLVKLGLDKCVSSYLEIKQKFNTQSDDPIFTGDFESFDCEFVIYNNAALEESFRRSSATEEVREVNSLFHFEPIRKDPDSGEDAKVDGDAKENVDVLDGDASNGKDGNGAKMEETTQSNVEEDVTNDRRIDDDITRIDGNNRKDELNGNAVQESVAEVNEATNDQVGNVGKDRIGINVGKTDKNRQKAVKGGQGKEAPKDKSAKQDAKQDAKAKEGKDGKGSSEEDKSNNVNAYKLLFKRSDQGKEFPDMMKAVREGYPKLLAGKLAKYISTDRYENMMSDEAIETYHVFLVQNVVTLQVESVQMIKNEKGDDVGEANATRVIRHGRFKDNFLEGTLENKDLAKFRVDLFGAYATYEMVSKKSRDIQFENEADESSAIHLLVSALRKATTDEKAGVIDEKGVKTEGKTIKKEWMTDEEWQNVCRLIGNVITYIAEQGKFKFAKPEVEYLGRNGQNFMNRLRSQLGIVDKESKELEAYTFNVLKDVAVRRLEGTDFKVPLAFGNIEPILNCSVENICAELLGGGFSSSGDEVVKETIKDVRAYNDVKKLVGKVLVSHECSETLFRLSDDKLDGDFQLILDTLKETLKERCHEGQFSFRIDIPKFPRLTLTCPDAIIEKDVDGFLKRLMILTGKPNHNELDVLIKETMRVSYHVAEADKEGIHLGISNKIQSWWEEKAEIVYLQKGDNYFQNVVRKGIRCGILKPDPHFIGRNKELDKMKELLQRIPPEKATAASQMVVICGMFGVGKSELVRKFAFQNGHLFDDNILWINAQSFRSMYESFHRICEDLKIPPANKDDNDAQSLVQAVYQYFPERKTLFIFDNAERYKSEEAGDVGIEKFLPYSLPPNKFTPRFVVTSQNRKWPSETTVNILEEFDDEEALMFTKNFLNIQKDVCHDHVIRKLIEKLGKLPLALRQAADYLRETDRGQLNIGEMIRSLCDNEDDMFSVGLDVYTKTVQNTMEVSLSTIRDKECGKEAEQLLLTMAYFAPNDIPVDLFNKLEMFSNNEALSSAIKLLKQYCLITGNAGSANVHRVVQRVLRFKLRHPDNKYLRNALTLFAECPNLREEHEIHYIVVCDHARQNGELVEEFLKVGAS